MSNIKSKSHLEFTTTLELSESETRALQALACYGDKAFLDIFYKHMGEAYLKPYEQGLRSLFNTIQKELPKHLSKIDETRELWKK